MPTPTTPILATEDLHRDFRDGLTTLQILQGVNVSVQPGEWLALLGQSGSGKSTLLHLMGGLDRPTTGRVLFEGKPLFPSSARTLDRYRSRSVGFVFQFYHLLPELNALENVMVGAMVGRGIRKWLGDRAAVRERAKGLLDSFGLGERLTHRPNKLSGGERQRVAIARALINEPAVLLADEPTGNLDAETGDLILNVFRELHAGGQTIVMVTHDQHIADAADRQLVLSKGKLHAD